MTSNSKSEGRDFVYVGASDIYPCPAGEQLSYRYSNEEDGKTLRRYWTRRIDGSDPRVRRARGPVSKGQAFAFLPNLGQSHLGPYPAIGYFQKCGPAFNWQSLAL
jgi:hypothetical protein